MQQTNLDIYGHAALPWSRTLKQLETDSDKTFWLATVRPDGRPHMTSVGALWDQGQVYFVSGPHTRKSRNLAHNPACVFSVALPDLDLVLEGTAARVTDSATLQRLAHRYNHDGQGWPVQVEGDAFTAPYSAPSAGPPPWYLYVLNAHTAFGVATAEPYGATRWTFNA